MLLSVVYALHEYREWIFRRRPLPAGFGGGHMNLLNCARNDGTDHFVIDLAFARCDARWGQLGDAVEAAARGLRRVGKEHDRRARLRSGVGVD